MDEEVKVHVRSEADNRALDGTEKRIRELYELSARYEAKGIPEAAKSVRSEAASLEKDVARYKREQHAAEKEITHERRAQNTEAQREESRRQRFGRAGMMLGMEAAQGGSLAGGISSIASTMGPAGMAGIAAVGAVAIGAIVESLTKDYTERQGIALRDQAARKMGERGLAIGAGWRGTSGQSQSEEFATEQRMAERAANRADLERQGRRAWYNPMRLFGAQTWEGQRNLDENDKAQQRDAEHLAKQREQTRKKFREEEGGIEMDLARHHAERTQSGQRAAFVDVQKKQWLARYRSLRGAGATDAEAAQTAGLEAETAMRDRQIAAGGGLVDARSGAGDIAAAARWAGMSTPGMAETKAAIDALHATVRSNSQKSEELQNRKDQSVP